MTDETEQTEENVASDQPVNVILPTCYGIKSGMTRIFDSAGNHVPVTVIKLIPNVISQVKTKQREGHDAYQIAYGEKRQTLINKPKAGILNKAKIDRHFSRFAEIKMDDFVDPENLGKEIEVTFAVDSYVDICGVTKGKGFQGVMKKFGFKGGPAAHGSKFHRTGGSIGNRATPGKVWKNKKMPGHMGSDVHTVQNLQVIELNKEQGYLLVRGAVPGPKNHFVRVAQAVKRKG